ncbi:MAG: DUF4179 domain-containing protein [Agathobaculum sp.]|jgi:hypothetical protein|uniref:DUF4179 domain-containing protein n=1 Tax=Agathobaculum sp. TaxID=2048138 RepID=UPI003D907F9B
MKFDDRIKARAAREGSPVPADFDRRMDALLDTLPEPVQPVKTRRPFRLAVSLGIAAVLVVGAAAGAPAMLRMAKNHVDFFGVSTEYASQADTFEQYNAAVGVSAERNGQTLTIDNLAADDNYLSVFFTLTSDAPIELVGDAKDPAHWRAQWTAPTFWAEVNGKPLDTTGSIENEAFLVDAHTLRGLHRLPLRTALPDQFDLLLYTGGTNSKRDADFRFPLSVDKSTVSSRTVEPGLDWPIHYEGTDELGERFTVDRTPRIERVSVSPLSSAITLSEQAPDGAPWDSFVLRDDKGNFLPRLPAGMSSSGFRRFSNVFEFIGADETTKSITVIPFISDYKAHEVKGALDDLPLTGGSANGLTLETLTVGKEQATATFSLRGAVWSAQAQFTLTDRNGEPVEFSSATYADSYVDRETGVVTATLYYPGATEAELASIAGVSFWQTNDDMVLLEDQAVTIALD